MLYLYKDKGKIAMELIDLKKGMQKLNINNFVTLSIRFTVMQKQKLVLLKITRKTLFS